MAQCDCMSVLRPKTLNVKRQIGNFHLFQSNCARGLTQLKTISKIQFPVKLWPNDNLCQSVSITVQSCSAIDRIENCQQNTIYGEKTTEWKMSSFTAQSCLRIDRIENRHQSKLPFRLIAKWRIFHRSLGMDEKWYAGKVRQSALLS